jgi:hypothetical protein
MAIPLLSKTEGFGWMGVIGPAIDSLVSFWLHDTISALADAGRRLCKKKAGLSMSFNVAGAHDAYLHVSHSDVVGPGPFGRLETWAFDTEVPIPVGGFPPPVGQDVWIMDKPAEARPAIRPRTYSKHSGKIYKTEGFMTAAIKETFTKARLDALSAPLAQMVATAIVSKIHAEYTAKGYTVTVVRS